MTAATSIDTAEIEKFSRIAADWWNPSGPFRPLHRLNPARLSYIRQQAIRHFGRDGDMAVPLTGLTALDIGCGGGLVAEPIARMGGEVTAVDVDANAIAAARTHAGERELHIDYRVGAAEDLVAEGGRFDIVLALEIVEHVADRDAFLAMLGSLVAHGGLCILSTLNRTLPSLALGIGAAEYLLRWVEPGTHDWRKFVKPSELASGLRHAGFELVDLTGLAFDPLKGAFRLAAGNVAINYFATAVPLKG
jgi:2-polyprenyl-6-hydroxyphenyl methylase/3-demethylubiquinone-9 3-methyltransferase